MPELYFSSLLDKSDCSSVGGSLAGQYLAVPGIVNEGCDTGERNRMDVCWPQSGWVSMCPGTENSGTDVANHLTQYWECWDSSGSYRADIPDLIRTEWETMDGKITLTDSRATSKEALSTSSEASTFDFSIMSKSSNSSTVTATHVQDFGIEKMPDQKSLLLDGHCLNGTRSFYEVLHTNIELTPNGVKEIEQKPQNISFLMRGGNCETDGMASVESGNVTNSKQLSPSDQHGTNLSVYGGSEVAEKTAKDTYSDSSVGMGAIDESSIVLKLGKHTYPEGTAASGNKATSSANPPPSKKQKVLSSVASAARCQAEGCKADLLRCKDYYRKHKVCEAHSKASKVKIGDKEQRFCQQCSRFHLLEEFDEGKRSCRRRLAGHNERRRKSQPVSMPLFNGENLFFSSDGKYSGIGHSEWSCFLDHLRSTWPPPSTLDQVALACQRRGLAFADTESLLAVLSHPAAEKILSLLWSPEGHTGNWTHHEIQSVMDQGSVHSKSLDAVHPYSDAFPASQSFKGTSDSGCALSLLSSSCLSSSAHCSMPFPPSGSFELFPSNNKVMPCQQISSNASNGEKSHFGHVSNRLMAATSQPHFLNGSHVINKEQHEQQSFDGRPILSICQGNEFQVMQGLGSQHGPCTMELMNIPALQSHGSQLEVMQQSWKGRFSEFEGLKAYEAMLGR